MPILRMDDETVHCRQENHSIEGANVSVSEEFLQGLLVEANNKLAMKMLPVIAYIGFLMTVGGIGNAIVFYVYKMKSKTTTKGIFISALAVLDLLVCSFTMSFEILDLRQPYSFQSEEFCKIVRLLEFCVVLSAGFTLLAVSVDRYLNLCRRKSRLLFTPSRAKKVCVFCVFLSMVFAWPTAIFAGVSKVTVLINGYQVEGTECTSFGDNEHYGMDSKAFIYSLNVVFIVSLLSMSTLYILIAIKLYRRRKGSVHKGLLYLETSKDADSLEKNKSKIDFEKCGYAIGKRGLKMKGSTVIFYSVTVVFILGFLPHLTVRILTLSGYSFDGDGRQMLYNFLIRSFLINSAANPFIYSLLHPRFRQEVKDTFRRCFRCSKCISGNTNR